MKRKATSKHTTDTPTFGSLLKQLREAAGMTLRGLGELAGIPHSVIAAIESNHRSPNLQTAERLADSLKVADRSAFLFRAISTTKNQRMLPFARKHNATVLNYLPLCLAHMGIEAASIQECRYGEPPFATGTHAREFEEYLVATLHARATQRSRRKLNPSDCPGLLLKLDNGQVLRVSVSVESGG